MIRPRNAPARDASDAEILGLEPQEDNPVTVILAAQMRLRRCRRDNARGSRGSAGEIRKIIAARDAMLSRGVRVREPATVGPTASLAAATAVGSGVGSGS